MAGASALFGQTTERRASLRASLDFVAIETETYPIDLPTALRLANAANPTVAVALLVGAVSVACAIFLILELNDPYGGLMRISDAPLLNALAQIGQ